ncbi:MAG: NAD(P)H-quinone oxidoreductase subunit 2 [Candidatus Melainabacteria bacterium]|nr:MAG: NAD(P)H-quinone oxidoreductase subunit 2 [Candidatus Melainabacteria bacterium]
MNGIEDYNLALKLLLPEMQVVVAIVIACLWNLFVPKQKSVTPIICCIALGLAFYTLSLEFSAPKVALFGGVFTVDRLTVAFGMIACAVGLIVVLMTSGYEYHFRDNAGEFYAILLTAVLAVMLLAGSTDLIMLFIGLETLSICCVILSGFEKRDQKSSEAALKYLLSTAATTATLLYGLSFLYGLTGSTNFDVIREQMSYLTLPPTSLVKMFLLVLILSAVGFKLSAVPFHMWTPDVYEGAPTPVTAFLSIGSKAGGFVIALRLLTIVFDKAIGDWGVIVGVMAALSMIAGNFIALAQTSFKRMLAYSSIAHVGYILIGLVSSSEVGLSAVLFYIVVYGAMNLGAFAGAILFTNETGSDKIDDFSGLVRKRPFLAIMLSICLLNLAGLPIPPAGFFAKVFIFGAGLTIPLTIADAPVGWILVAIALFTTVPAIYYYTRVVIKMIVREPSEVVAALPDHRRYVGSSQGGPIVALGFCVLAIISTGTIVVNPVMNFAHNSMRPLLPMSDRYTPGSQPYKPIQPIVQPITP